MLVVFIILHLFFKHAYSSNGAARLSRCAELSPRWYQAFAQVKVPLLLNTSFAGKAAQYAALPMSPTATNLLLP
jgi:hypothetical protein